MYTEKMLESIKKVEATRAERMGSEPRRMTAEEKDELLSEYGILRCDAAALASLPTDAVKGKKESPYGVTAIVRRDAVDGAQLSPISIEDLFIFMIRGSHI